MSDYAYFMMDSAYRDYLISTHKFHVDQSKRRLLGQFSDIENEANQLSDEWPSVANIHFDPDRYDPGDFLEQAHHKGIEYYGLLLDLQESTRLNIVASMFYLWEKLVRDWLAREILHWHKGEYVNGAIWKMNFAQLMELFEKLGWKIKNEEFYLYLDLCRNVVNAHKHGEGDSFEKLKNEHPEFFKKLPIDIELPMFLDHSDLRVNDSHLDTFSEAIVNFWEKVPDQIRASNNPTIPEWLNKAFKKDNNQT